MLWMPLFQKMFRTQLSSVPSTSTASKYHTHIYIPISVFNIISYFTFPAIKYICIVSQTKYVNLSQQIKLEKVFIFATCNMFVSTITSNALL